MTKQEIPDEAVNAVAYAIATVGQIRPQNVAVSGWHFSAARAAIEAARPYLAPTQPEIITETAKVVAAASEPYTNAAHLSGRQIAEQIAKGIADSKPTQE